MAAFILSNQNGKLKCKFKLFRDSEYEASRPTIAAPGILHWTLDNKS